MARMSRYRWPIDALALYLGALLLIALARSPAFGVSAHGWWLIPFLWVAAAAAPSLWSETPHLTRDGLIGRPLPALGLVGALTVLVFPIFGLAYLVAVGAWPPALHLPPGLAGVALYQILYIGLSEELFFRGYLQQQLDAVFGRPYRLLGATFGPGLVLANLLFALGHVALTLDLGRLDVFFPGLIFGWLAARTGAVFAPALFHGLCNVALFVLRAWAGYAA